MRKFTSKSSTNRRQIVPELMLTNIMQIVHKQAMKQAKTQQELTTATYLAHTGYTQTKTAKPVFQEATRTVTAVQPAKDFASILANSSFKHVYERAKAMHQKTILECPPQTTEEHQYATRGVIS